MNEELPTWVEVSRTDKRRKIREHALVLQAMGIGHGEVQDGSALVLLVRAEDGPRAHEQIERYERENSAWPPREEAPLPISDGIQAAVAYAGALVLFYLLVHRQMFDVDWAGAGRVDGALVRRGEWWRALTALTLHVDLTHLASNVVFGAVFGVILAQSLGSGLAWACFALSGAIGNLVNAYVQPPDHASIGASTGVFGALGVQVAFEWMRRKELRYGRFRRIVPLAMGVVLLGWIGFGGASFNAGQTAKETEREVLDVLDKVDVMAHVTGLGAGLAIGVLLGLLRNRFELRGAKQTVLAWSTIASLVAAWAIALVVRR